MEDYQRARFLAFSIERHRRSETEEASMAQTPTITEAAIRTLARPQSYDRGEDYYEQGAVRDITRRGDRLGASVNGSQYETYQVQI